MSKHVQLQIPNTPAEQIAYAMLRSALAASGRRLFSAVAQPPAGLIEIRKYTLEPKVSPLQAPNRTDECTAHVACKLSKGLWNEQFILIYRYFFSLKYYPFS